MTQRHITFSLSTLFATLFLLYAIAFFEFRPSVAVATVITEIGQITQIIEEPPVEIERAVFVGDILLARDVETKINLLGSTYPFEGSSLLLKQKIVVGNFEATIPIDHTQTKNLSTVFSVASSSVQGMSSSGFTHVSLANNHSMDFGDEGFVNTILELLRADIIPAGQYSGVATSSISYFNLNTERVALISLNTIAEKNELDNLEEIMAVASTTSDHQIAFVHWGSEYKLINSRSQEQLAKRLVEYGADAVIGHHPHVVQNIEIYKDVPIFYSLGNFVFDQYFSEEVQQGLALTLEIVDKKLQFTLHPISSIDSQTQPREMAGYEADRFLSSLAERSGFELREMILHRKITTTVDFE